MATFVLVHGAMHGGWCWSGVRVLLQSGGHAVHTPTLTGQGDRRHQLTPEVGVGTHVDDIAELLWFEDLSRVHLVLHSYAGILAGPLADRVGDRLASITYLGAFLTRPGESLLDVEPDETAERYRALVTASGDGWRLPASPAFLEQWSVPPEQSAFVGDRLTDFPYRCVTDPTPFNPDRWESVPKSYVHHSAPPLANLRRSHERAVEEGFAVHDIASGHDMMIVAPGPTASLLEQIAASHDQMLEPDPD